MEEQYTFGLAEWFANYDTVLVLLPISHRGGDIVNSMFTAGPPALDENNMPVGVTLVADKEGQGRDNQVSQDVP